MTKSDIGLGNVPNTDATNADNIGSGTLAVGRGGTGVGSFGGTNTLLYTSVANTLGSIATANNGILVTSPGGVPSISNTVGAALTMPSLNLSGTSNQIVMQSGGVSGTLSWSPTGSGKTITFPDASGTVALVGGATSWSTLGNTGTNPATNFIGTADNVDMVFRTNNVESMRLEASTGDLLFGGASIGTVKANQELIMRQDGDTYGSSILRLRNRNDENGAIFETTDASVTLVDFIFKTAVDQRNIRYESRAQARAGSPSFHIGGSDGSGADPDNPTLAVGDDYSIFKNRVKVGDNTYTAPTALLHIGAGTATTAPFKLSSGTLLASPQIGAIEFNNDSYYATITTGTARRTFAFLESPAFTTPNIGAATGTSLQLSGLDASRPVKTDASKNLVSGNIDLASTDDVSGILPVANGGTGSTTKNFVDLTTNQTVAGSKTWSNLGTFSAGLTVTGGTVNLNNDASTNGVNIGGTGIQTIAIGAGGTGAKTISIGDGASTGSTSIESGTGALNIGVSNAARTITIGTNTAGTAQTVNINNTANAGIVNIGNGMTTGSITIGGTGAHTGNINIGTGTGTQAINLGTGGTNIKTISIGGTAANVIGIGNTQNAGSVSIGNAMTTGTVNIGGTGAQTGQINIGTGTGAQTLNFGTGGTGSKTINIGTGAIANTILIGNTTAGTKTGINVATSTAQLHLGAGTAGANQGAPLKFTAGTNLTTAEDGAVEYDGTNYFVTSGSTRYTLAKTLTASSALDFPNTAGWSNSDLTIPLTGATIGDVVVLGIPVASTNANSYYIAFVSLANTVTVRFLNNSASAYNPASGNFRVSVIQY